MHFRRFTANEGAAGFLAGSRHTFHNISHLRRNKFSYRQIIEEKERLRPLHKNIIHAHGHRILPDGIMFIKQKRQFQFRPHAVGSRNQHRFPILCRIEGEQASKPA